MCVCAYCCCDVMIYIILFLLTLDGTYSLSHHSYYYYYYSPSRVHIYVYECFTSIRDDGRRIGVNCAYTITYAVHENVRDERMQANRVGNDHIEACTLARRTSN